MSPSTGTAIASSRSFYTVVTATRRTLVNIGTAFSRISGNRVRRARDFEPARDARSFFLARKNLLRRVVVDTPGDSDRESAYVLANALLSGVIDG